MKKAAILSILYILFTTNLFAQDTEYIPFLEEGISKTWAVEGLRQSGVHTYEIAPEADTIINGLAYRSIQVSPRPPGMPPFMALREQDKKVYLYIVFSQSIHPLDLCQHSAFEGGNHEIQLYDFSIKKGDVFTLANCGHLEYENVRHWVEEEETIVIEGVVRKKWKLKSGKSPVNQTGGYEEWIEGIGSRHGLIPDVLLAPLNVYYVIPYSSKLICVQEAGRAIYSSPGFLDSQGDYNCYRGGPEEAGEVTATPTPSQANTFAFQAFPNIFAQTTTLQFVLPENSMTSLQIYNNQGEKVKTLLSNEILNRGEHQETLQLDGVPNGIYYTVLSLNGTTMKVHKIMKMN